MENWGAELALGLSMNIAVVVYCWVRGWRPVDTGSSIRWHDAQRDEEQTDDDAEHELLWSGGVETTAGLVIAVAVMVAVATEIASENGARVTAYSRY
ncbi:hypothetical protein PR003_g17758 [Phytophthora rubi]|uniref:Uncharacterized protein n=1 Tax=Phytophthora rubi TaxID=129364 RepID=A0A6A4EJX5_9STRA|nr:hypothetical protein PR002_g17131 [Phytophthora rubi]KAE9010383.1 hypothetical protein PR001_g16191 [Phytophthora rubi]KAE9320272.1 hypothetical protein PR003_g17758 [Phytophthora rubi]